jgi:hypothetical protein
MHKYRQSSAANTGSVRRLFTSRSLFYRSLPSPDTFMHDSGVKADAPPGRAFRCTQGSKYCVVFWMEYSNVKARIDMRI